MKSEQDHYKSKLLHLDTASNIDAIMDRTIHGNILEIAKYLPTSFVDLLILDPPYNLSKIVSFQFIFSKVY